MPTSRIELRSDHAIVHLEGRKAALAPHREVVIPYSDIVEAKAERPAWPTLAGQWQIAAYLPRVVAVGDFHDWGGRKRLLAIDRATSEALTIKLAGHPLYDEITIDARDATLLAGELQKHAARDEVPWRGPAPRE